MNHLLRQTAVCRIIRYYEHYFQLISVRMEYNFEENPRKIFLEPYINTSRQQRQTAKANRKDRQQRQTAKKDSKKMAEKDSKKDNKETQQTMTTTKYKKNIVKKDGKESRTRDKTCR